MSDVLNQDGTPIANSLATATVLKAPAEMLAAMDAGQARIDELNRCIALYAQVVDGSLAGGALASLLNTDEGFAAFYASRLAGQQ